MFGELPQAPNISLVEILSFATSHYPIVCNQVSFVITLVVCATNMQVVVYKMDMCHKNHDLS